MDRSKARISKACQECRLRKIRCNGNEPCQRCQSRNLPCEFRKKARNRMKKSDLPGPVGAVSCGSAADAHSSQSYRDSDDGHSSPQTSRGPTSNAAPIRHSQRISSIDTASKSPGGSRSSSLRNQSVSATHRASPSVFLQLYYGPSSNFSLLNSIYHQIEDRRTEEVHASKRRKTVKTGNVPQPPSSSRDGNDKVKSREGNTNQHDDDVGHDDGANGNDVGDTTIKDVEEFGPGLDLFGTRRLYFGDLAAGAETSMVSRSFTDGAAMFIDRVLAERLLERYLSTFWLVLPIWSRDTFRSRLASFYEPSYVLASGDPDAIIVLLGLALGASMLDEELAARYLYNMAKNRAAEFDEMVNVQMVQISLMMSHYSSERARPNSSFLLAGTAVRKAIAAGLHKGVGGSSRGNAAQQSPDAARQMRITIWSVYFWETWLCFSLGRPSSISDSEMDVPFPTEEKLLFSIVTLARIMSKSAKAIYRKHHDSLLPLWIAANEIRLELRTVAVQLREDFNFGVRDDPNTGELGMCQAIVSTLYHHTLILTFRPFLILRATLRQKDIKEGTDRARPPPPPWLDTAAEYCIDAARHSIAFLIRAFEKDEICRGIRYHGFFIEGASHVLAFELLNNANDAARESHLHWIQLAIRALQLVTHNRNAKYGIPFPVDVAGTLERMIRSVYPDFRADQVNTSAKLPSIPSIQSGILASGTATASLQAQQQLQPQTLAGNARLDSDTRIEEHDDIAAFAKRSSDSPYVGGHRGADAASPFSVAQQQMPQASQLQLPAMSPKPPATMNAVASANALGNANLHSSPLPGVYPAARSTQVNLTDVSSLGNLSNALPPLLFPFTPFGGHDEVSSIDRVANGHTPGLDGSLTQSSHRGGLPGAGGNPADGLPVSISGEAPPADLTAADLGCDFDFGTMNMEAFLSFDTNLPFSF
ncbi:hypothetical protein SEPCBS119000_004864 [Sporothrix epigloea]|uniref:Zn(2)-C6 fungal-type domain-containing protein n=1 Tax=Sporothrix epigloea TaxID=1892477 RepID=A0ABP0DUG3_9PEZI